MANGTTPAGVTVLSPEDFAKSWNAKYGSGASVAGAPAEAPATGKGKVRILSPDEFRKSWAKRGAAPEAEPTPAGPAEPAGPAAPKPKMGLLGEEAPSRKEMGTLPWLGEGAIELGGNILGGIAGGALNLPAAIGEATTIAGIPLAAASEYAAIRGGEAAGQTGGQAINALLNQRYYGRKANITPKTLGEQFLANVPGTIIGERIAHYLPVGKMVGKFLSRDQMTEFAGKAARDAEEAVTAAKSGFADELSLARQGAQEKATTSIQDAQRQILKRVQPIAAKEAEQRSLGRTVDESIQASRLPANEVGGPGPEAVQRSQNFLKTMYGPKNRTAESFDKRFEDTFAPHKDKPFLPGNIQKAATEEGNYAEREGFTYSKKTQDLLDEGSRGLKDPPVKVKTPRAPKPIQTSKGVVYKPPEPTLTPEQLAAAQGELAPDELAAIKQDIVDLAQKPKGETVRKLLTYRSRLGAEMKTATGRDLAALHNMWDSVNTTLTDMNVPGAQDLRGAYRGFMGAFGPEFNRAVGKAASGEPSTAMSMFFDPKNPGRAVQWLKLATADEKASMRTFFADGVNLGYVSPDPAFRGQLYEMGFRGALTEPQAWQTAEHILDEHLPQMIDQNPGAKRVYQEAMQRAVEKANVSNDADIIKIANHQINHLPAAQKADLIAKLRAEPTAAGKAQVALREFDLLSPQQAGAKAGGQAVYEFKPTDSRMIQFMKRRALYGALLGPGTAGIGVAMGHPFIGSTMLIGAVLAGTPLATRQVLRAAWLKSVQASPAIAEGFYKDLINPGAKGAIDRIAERMIQATLQENASSMIRKQAGVSLEAPQGAAPEGAGAAPPAPAAAAAPTPAAAPPPTTRRATGPGPMAQQIDRHKATQMASARGQQDPTHIDNVQDLNQQIASRKIPDIHQDLSTGRLSNQEVRKMVDSPPTNLASTFQGMSLDDAMAAFDRGTDEEKQNNLSALAQKLNDEGRNLPPAQRRAYMARLRQALPQLAAEQGAMA